MSEDPATAREFKLKPLSQDAVDAALQKVERYRLLNEPENAESICRDILAVEPGNKKARIDLILALADQFNRRLMQRVGEATELASGLEDAYERAYYQGIVCERRAKAQYERRLPQSGQLAYTSLMQAMGCFEEAGKCRPKGNDDPILRWNTCARMIMEHPDICPCEDDEVGPPAMLE